MNKDFEYYYNSVPGIGKCRNNLIYTSLMSKNKDIFCQWYYNDETYHGGQNKVVDQELMGEKWRREMNYYYTFQRTHKEHLLDILDLNYLERKAYYKTQGPDFWELSGCDSANFDSVLPNWREQMHTILSDLRKQKIWKFSLHPSSYFIIDGKLKTTNFFFCYNDNEYGFAISDIISHISDNRLTHLRPLLDKHNIILDEVAPFRKIGLLALDSFSDCYDDDFVNAAKKYYV